VKIEYIALIISIVSVLVASISLGWNIYRDVILKAKVDVTFAVVSVIHQSLPDRPQYLNLKATNFGPGPVTMSTICVREASVWRRAIRKVRFAIITPDYTNPMSAKLPAKIEVGDKIELLLPYDKDCFFKLPFTHVGISDYYGRIHWAPRKQFKEARATWIKDFLVKPNPTEERDAKAARAPHGKR